MDGAILVDDFLPPSCEIPCLPSSFMFMQAVRARWSVDEVWALPEEPGKRYETVDGELLVTPAPRALHQLILGEIHVTLHAYLRTAPGNVVLMAPSDVVLDDFTLVQPDMYVMERTADILTRPTKQRPKPVLAIEVLSPTTNRQDRFVKRQRYLRDGIECWLVDGDQGVIEQWAPGSDQPTVCRDVLRWTVPGARTELELDVEAIMREARGRA